MVAQQGIEHTISGSSTHRNQRHAGEENLQRSQYPIGQVTHNQSLLF